jgi:hypothetical protein
LQRQSNLHENNFAALQAAAVMQYTAMAINTYRLNEQKVPLKKMIPSDPVMKERNDEMSHMRL